MLDFIYDGKQAFIQFQNLNVKCENNFVGSVKPNNSSYTVNIKTSLPFSINKKKNNKNNSLFSLLKSNLQKQIRRQDIKAIATCELMLEMNDFETLRRLCIIAAEDVEITEETSVISWLMAATSKNYSLSNDDKQFVFQYVRQLVLCSTWKEVDHSKRIFSLENIMESNFTQKGILAGIYLRSCYGGLSGDIPMYINACYHSFCNGLKSFPSSVNIEIKTTFDFHAAAIDFHIYPELCNRISKDTNINSDEIKRLIWICSSRINTRKNYIIGEEDAKLWALISKCFKYHSLEYLSKIIKTYF